LGSIERNDIVCREFAVWWNCHLVRQVSLPDIPQSIQTDLALMTNEGLIVYKIKTIKFDDYFKSWKILFNLSYSLR
jgi:hypothetical protein